MQRKTPLRPQRRAPAQIRRKRCQICHDLNPRGHSSSTYNTEADTTASASLSIVLDLFGLARVKDVAEGGCRFCHVLVQALDALSAGWKGSSRKAFAHLTEKGTIKVEIDSDKWKGDLIEIYAGSGKRLSCGPVQLIRVVLLPARPI